MTPVSTVVTPVVSASHPSTILTQLAVSGGRLPGRSLLDIKRVPSSTLPRWHRPELCDAGAASWYGSDHDAYLTFPTAVIRVRGHAVACTHLDARTGGRRAKVVTLLSEAFTPPHHAVVE